MLSLYGLKNSDTCRKAVKWLTENGIDSCFVDVWKDGLVETDISRWASLVGGERHGGV